MENVFGGDEGSGDEMFERNSPPVNVEVGAGRFSPATAVVIFYRQMNRLFRMMRVATANDIETVRLRVCGRLLSYFFGTAEKNLAVGFCETREPVRAVDHLQ
jgi:hypothetical protein